MVYFSHLRRSNKLSIIYFTGGCISENKYLFKKRKNSTELFYDDLLVQNKT
jgi:hypothetical protein